MNEKTQKIIALLEKEYPNTRVALDYKNPLELLIATILSAQCTDKRVNIVTKKLFQKYRNARDYANAPLSELEEDIKSTGFYRNKARNIKEACRMLVEKHGGWVPDTMAELLMLPGVARKTANIVLSNAFGKVEGIAVDTHVKRLSTRLGLTENTDQDKIERDLMDAIPKEKWFKVNHMLVSHGRKTCNARKPLCEQCTLNKICPSAFKAK